MMKNYLIPYVIITSLFGGAVFANQMFRGGGNSGKMCPSGSSYAGSGFCKSQGNNQFFRGGGNSGKMCPSGSSYAGSGFCRTR